MAQLPVVTGLQVRYIGAQGLGTTNWFYWVQAIYEAGVANLSASGSTGAKAPAGLSGTAFNQIQWNAMPGAIGYIVWRSTSSTTPATGGTIVFLATSETGFKDDGSFTLTTTTPRIDGLYVAKAVYNFAVDGGLIGAITPAISDTIPTNAILVGGQVNPTTAPLPAGANTVAIGTTAGASATALLAATATTSLTVDALLNVVPTFAAARKMTAAGQINITVATSNLTAGVIEIFVLYLIPANV